MVADEVRCLGENARTLLSAVDLNQLREIDGRRMSPAEHLAAEKTALIIVDMTNSFCDPEWHAHGDEEKKQWAASELEIAIPNIQQVLAIFRQTRAMVVHVVTAKWTTDAREAVPYARGRDYGLFDSDPMSVIEQLAPIPGEVIIRKVTSSSFTGTGLDYLLKNAGIENVVITGQYGDACCFYTLIQSREFGFSNYWVQDCLFYSMPLYRELHAHLVPIRWAKLATHQQIVAALASGRTERR